MVLWLPWLPNLDSDAPSSEVCVQNIFISDCVGIKNMDLKGHSVIKLRMKFNESQSKGEPVDANKRVGEMPAKDAGRNIRPTERTQCVFCHLHSLGILCSGRFGTTYRSRLHGSRS
jgi:hypothetical protein